MDRNRPKRRVRCKPKWPFYEMSSCHQLAFWVSWIGLEDLFSFLAKWRFVCNWTRICIMLDRCFYWHFLCEITYIIDWTEADIVFIMNSTSSVINHNFGRWIHAEFFQCDLKIAFKMRWFSCSFHWKAAEVIKMTKVKTTRQYLKCEALPSIFAPLSPCLWSKIAKKLMKKPLLKREKFNR